jgi:glycosyltransferase involved in cell wall biosynthesis
MYHYYYLVCKRLNINPYEIIKNEIKLNNQMKTIVLLDAMDIKYDIYTPYTKGLGGTQLCYINLATILSHNHNIILMNRNKNDYIIKINNIHIINYNNLNEMCIYLNNINSDLIIYNFIEYGKILKDNLNFSKTNINDISYSPKLWMYEHITINSHYDLKIKSNYKDYYDKIIFVSKHQLLEYKKNCNINNHNSAIMYNRLSPIFYFNKLETNILENKELSIIYFSNPQRGLDNFIEIFPLLKEKYKNLKLKVFSSLEMYDIDDNDDLKNLYKKLNEIDGVEVNKSVSQLELIDELNKALLFIYPTYISETFCNCCIEAGSCGCSIISTNIGGLNEVLEDYGDLIDVNIDNMSHPYYDIITNDYIENIVNKASIIIEKYLIKCTNLENKLQNQIKFLKKKYSYHFYENII